MHILHIYAGKTHTDNKSKKKKNLKKYFTISIISYPSIDGVGRINCMFVCLFGWLVGWLID